ncbi:MAG TPA: hypothetical protein VJ521_15580, partial [Acidobacteriota bacterium]|nr:hypothetical protein [Acidobacteriota bacterium]
LIRMAIWNLRRDWDANQPALKKLSAMAHHMSSSTRPEEIEAAISIQEFPVLRLAVNEDFVDYGAESKDAIEKRLRDSGVSFRKTGRAEKIPGFGQAPDFCIPFS